MDDLQEVVTKLVEHGPHNIASTSGRRVSTQINGILAIDTTSAIYVWEHPYYPQFYVPFKELHHALIVNRELVAGIRDPESGTFGAEIWSYPKAASDTDKKCTYVHFLQGKLKDYVRFTFKDMDHWYEEEEPIYVHPKDPTKRISILPSARPLEISIDGVVLAKPTMAHHLIEPLLPVRYYIAPTFVNMKILKRSDLKTQCPYKGDAEYYHVVVNGKTYENAVWYYRYPTHECAAIAGLLCFYNEKVDIKLDDKALERPITKFS